MTFGISQLLLDVLLLTIFKFSSTVNVFKTPLFSGTKVIPDLEITYGLTYKSLFSNKGYYELTLASNTSEWNNQVYNKSQIIRLVRDKVLFIYI